MSNILFPNSNSYFQVQDLGDGTFKAEFCPKNAGEHQIYITFREEQVPGSPFACKVV